MKRNTPGLRVRKTAGAARSSVPLAAIPAALCFLALAGLLITVTGLTALVPLFTSGLVCLALYALAKRFQKEHILLPALLVLLLVAAILCRALLLNGFAALWNGMRGLWAAELGILLPLAETDGGGLWLASVLLALLLAAISLLLAHRPMLSAALLIVLTVAASLVHATAWLFVAAGVSLLLLTLHRRSLAAPAACLAGALVCTLLAATLCRSHPLRDAAAAAQFLPHRTRYEIAAHPLPEGRLSQNIPNNSDEKVLLSVTSDHADTLYLRGFVGDVYENGDWKPLSTQFTANSKDLFYWLHENGFYPQSQLAFSALQNTDFTVETVNIENISACSLYRYEPCSVLPGYAGTAKNKLQPSAVATRGWNGEREYSYTAISNISEILPDILNNLQENSANAAYLQMESAYRDFVDSYALDVPQEFLDEMGDFLEETRKTLNFSGDLTDEQAQICALTFLETCFDGDTSLPLDATAKSTTYQYATVAALALRYYGIPSRYTEGFTVKTVENENISVTSENAGAWVEVYQDGVGWLPLALTPGLEDLAPEQTESGIKPIGTGENGTNSGPKITEGQEPEQDAEQSEESDETPDGGQRTGLLATPAFWLLLLAALLLLYVAFILIRRTIILKKRRKKFENPDIAAAICSLFSDAAALLSALGLDRGNGSMAPLYDPIFGRFGETAANAFRDMYRLNEKALFSSKTPEPAARAAMLEYHKFILDLLKSSTKWPQRLRLKWLNCLY